MTNYQKHESYTNFLSGGSEGQAKRSVDQQEVSLLPEVLGGTCIIALASHLGPGPSIGRSPPLALSLIRTLRSHWAAPIVQGHLPSPGP